MNSNGKISAPVTTEDIQLVLGISEVRQSRLCVSEAINKYSTIKPIVYPTQGDSCPDFRGTSKDMNDGYFYGLHAGGSEWGIQIHSVDWAYKRPSGGIGISPFRRLDFNGYNHNAQPTLRGRIIQPFAKVDYNSTTPFSCEVTFNTITNNDGVDVCSCTQEKEPIFYLCVAVDNYVAIMRDDTGSISTLPSVEFVTRTFLCPQLPSALRNISTRQVTFFIADIEASGLAEFSQLLSGNWVAFTDGTRGDISYITLPDAVAYSVDFGGSAVDYGTLTFEITYASKKDAFDIYIDWVTRPSVDRRYVLQFKLNGFTDVLQKQFSGGTGKEVSILISREELGIRWSEGEIYTYTAEIYGYEGNVITPEPLLSVVDLITIE